MLKVMNLWSKQTLDQVVIYFKWIFIIIIVKTEHSRDGTSGREQIQAREKDRERLLRGHLPRNQYIQRGRRWDLKNLWIEKENNFFTFSVAIKLEGIKTKHPQLHIESKFYRIMQGGVGIPAIKWCGSEGKFATKMSIISPTVHSPLIRELQLWTILIWSFKSLKVQHFLKS